jgi:hypothetical protein
VKGDREINKISPYPHNLPYLLFYTKAIFKGNGHADSIGKKRNENPSG